MTFSKIEAQRVLERIGRLENQVASLNFKLQALETMLKPENLVKRVREGETEEKRKAEAQPLVSLDLLKQDANKPK